MSASPDAPTVRHAIAARAAQRMREHGLSSLSFASVSDVNDGSSGAADPHAHFEHLDALQAAALEAAMTHLRGHIDATRPGPDALRRFANDYLTEQHRMDPANGCPIAALGGELGRASDVVKASFEMQLDLLIRDLAASSGATRDDVLAEIAMCVGAMVIARAVQRDDAARDVLHSARSVVTRIVGGPR
jgi:TetR/AcrR family transcriptional repressor of nem operon